MFKRAYVEITNVCNLACSFCIGTRRPARFMTPEEFDLLARKIRPHTDYLYLHVMGEPLLHPALDEILSIASAHGFIVNLTTNGTLLAERTPLLLATAALRKVSVSLHSFEGNRNSGALHDYLDTVWSYCTQAKSITELRLWNEGGRNSKNREITDYLSEKLSLDVLSLPEKNGGRTLAPKLHLVSSKVFDWPSLSSPVQNVRFCHGLRDQFAVLVDGTVVPCCLDSDGSVPLGNLFESDLDTILAAERAKAIVQGFAVGQPSEELCRRCQFATRFTK